MKIIEILNEKLEDIPIKNIITHKTNAGALIDIFKNGYLKGFTYNNRSGAETYKSANFIYDEIATSRISGKIPDENLSHKIGKVTFYIYKDRLNLKIKPIAELVIEEYRSLRENIEGLLDYLDIINYTKKNINDLINVLVKKYNSLSNPYSMSNKKIIPDSIYEIFNKKFKETLFHKYNDDIFLNLKTIKLQTSAESRESEERIITDRIPLDNKTMSIRLENGFLDELEHYGGSDYIKYKDFIKYDKLIQNTPEKTRVLKYLESKD